MSIQDKEKEIRKLFREWVDLQDDPSKVRYAGPALNGDDYDNVLSALFSGWWSGGSFTIQAERKLARFSKREHGLLVNSGSSANLVLISAAKDLYNFKDGTRILTLACGFPSTVSPIIQNNMRPRFVDIDLDTLALDPQLLEDELKADTSIRAIFVAHTLGFPNNIEDILTIAARAGANVFFDCCDAYGTIYKSKPIQAFGDAATFSFYVAHHLTMGEGGGIVTDSAHLQNYMRGMRNWGRYCSHPECCIRSEHPEAFCPPTKLTRNADLPEDYSVNYQFEWLGYNLKPLELQSAMLLSQLDRAREFDTIRIANYKKLYDYFNSHPKFQFKTWELKDGVSPFSFPILMPDDAPFRRVDMINHLKRKKIETRLLFGGNLTKHPAFTNNSQRWDAAPDLSNSDRIMNEFIMLGVSQVNSLPQIQRVIDSVESFLGSY